MKQTSYISWPLYAKRRGFFLGSAASNYHGANNMGMRMFSIDLRFVVVILWSLYNYDKPFYLFRIDEMPR